MVGSGIKAQSENPEVKVKGKDPVISQIIDKLKHIIQVRHFFLWIHYSSNYHFNNESINLLHHKG